MTVWFSEEPPPSTTPDILGWARIVLRGPVLVLTVYGGFSVFLLARLVEWPWGRPFSPYVTQLICRSGLKVLGISYRVSGKPMELPGIVVANHVSWLDIFALNASQRIFFVAKREVRSWFGIGILARANGAVFIERNSLHARTQKMLFLRRLANGDRLLFFPEGTSTDGLRVLRFKSTLFAVLFDPDFPMEDFVQPVSLIYSAPKGKDPRFYGYWGDISMRSHLLAMLAAPLGGSIDAVFHEPVRAQSFKNRKALSLHCEKTVRDCLTQWL